MPPVDYIALPTAVAFPAPPHPGNLPTHVAGSTAAQITQTNREYDYTVGQFKLYTTVSEKLKKLILDAVDAKYLAALEDETMGFATVTPAAMLTHLFDTYGDIKPIDLDANRDRLTAPWVPEQSLEDLWKRIRDCQTFATAGGEAISDTTAIRLILTVLKNTGVFSSAIDKWKDKGIAAQTMAALQAHFKEENDRRTDQATSAQAGFHRANGAASLPSAPAAAAARAVMPPSTTIIAPPGGTVVYYCWSHGINFSSQHTSATCNHTKPGHCATATIKNMQGGSTTVLQRGRQTSTRITPAAPTT
jgi:hypothetical protein